MAGIHSIEEGIQLPAVPENVLRGATPAVDGQFASQGAPEPTQVAVDRIEEASMESFPCSDPPGYTMRHS
jgi:hypothetical protein